MEIITGYRGTPHLTSEKERRLIRGIFGSDSVVLGTGQKLAATVVNNTTVRIADGDLIQKGALGGIKKGTTENVTFSAGTSGQNRIDLIVCRYTKNSSSKVESMALAVKKGTATSGTPTAPSVTSGDISAGATTDEFALYQVRFTGTSITSVTRVAEPVRSLKEAVYWQ